MSQNKNTSDLYLVELTIPMVVQATSPEDASAAARGFFLDQWGDAAEENKLVRVTNAPPDPLELQYLKYYSVDITDLHPYRSDAWYAARGIETDDETTPTVAEILATSAQE